MKSIFKREWRSLFHSFHGFLFLGLFFSITGSLLTVFHFLYGYANFEFDLSYLTIFLWVLLPLVTIPLFREDREGGTKELLLSLPLSPFDILWGKILAAFSFLGLAILIVSICPLILGFFGTVHYLSAYMACFAFLIFGVAVLSIEIFISLAVKNPILVWVISYSLPMGAILLNYLSNILPLAFAEPLRLLTLFGSFTPFVFGSFSLGHAAFYLSVGAIFLCLTLFLGKRVYGRGRPPKDESSVKKVKKATLLSVSLLVLCALLLNVGIFLIPRPFRTYDVSQYRYYTFSDNTKDFLSSVDEDVTLYVICEGEREMRFEYFLDSFASHSSHIKLSRLSLEDSDEVLAKVSITKENLSGVQYVLVLEGEKRAEAVDYSSLFFYITNNQSLNQLGLSRMTLSEYYQYYNYIYQMASQDESYTSYLDYLVNDTYMYFQGESILSQMLEYVTAELIPTNYVLTGHGEVISENSLFTNMLSTYGVTYATLDLSASAEIPEDASNLILLAPTEDYSASEVDAMKAYLDGGGQMILVTGEENLSMPNLTALLSSYGLRAESGAVWDEVEVKDTEEGEEAETTTEWQSSVSVTVNDTHDSMAMSGSAGQLTPVITGGNAISFFETDDPSLILTPLLTTSENAAIEKNPDAKGEKVLAAAAETSKGAHLVWFTGAPSYTVTTDVAMVDESVIYNNFCLYLAMNWTGVRYGSVLTAPDPIRYTEASLTVNESSVAFYGSLMILLIPAALIGCGVILRYKRKKA